MTDIATIAALMFGFALVCVLGVVYLLSKRQITVTQNNSTSVTTTERTDSGTGGSGRFERFVIKWAFVLLVAGIVIATLANALTTSFSASFPNASVGNPVIATPATMPTAAAPTIAPAIPREEVQDDTAPSIITTLLTIAVPLLVVAVAAIWTVAIVGLSQHRNRRRAIDARRAASLRESNLEEILPDAVNKL